MSYYPTVYIVLVNYKGWQDTIECLESLYKLTYANFRVVVVDNDSGNNSLGYLEEWANGMLPFQFEKRFYNTAPIEPNPIPKPVPYQLLEADQTIKTASAETRLYLIQSETNRGFAGGNNIGIRLALQQGADYIWLLNNDTVTVAPTLTQLVCYFEANKESGKRLGVLGAKLLYYHNPNLIQAVLGRYNPLMATTEHIGLNQPASCSFSTLSITENDYIVGASMFVSAAYVREVGLMAEEYFLYFEELDWIKRGRKKQFEFDVCLNAIVYHKEGASIGGGTKSNNTKSELSDFYSIRNRLIITKRYYKSYRLSAYFSLLLVAANRIRRKQFKRIPLLLKALQSSLKSAA